MKTEHDLELVHNTLLDAERERIRTARLKLYSKLLFSAIVIAMAYWLGKHF
jgi:hypothetical protein